MPNDSNSIDDLLGEKKGESNPSNLPTPDHTAQPEATPKQAPQAPEVAPVVPERPRTLEEDIVGNPEQSQGESEEPTATPQAVQQAATDDDQGAADQVVPVSPVAAVDFAHIKELPRKEQIQVLTEVVMSQGLDKAIATVKKLDNPYLYDLLHDTLVDELYQKLKGPSVKR